MPRSVHGEGERNGLIANLVDLDRQLGVAAFEEGVPMRDVAEVIAAKTGLPASVVDPEQLVVVGALLGGDQPASSTATRELLGWEPTGPTLLADLEADYYTA